MQINNSNNKVKFGMALHQPSKKVLKIGGEEFKAALPELKEKAQDVEMFIGGEKKWFGLFKSISISIIRVIKPSENGYSKNPVCSPRALIHFEKKAFRPGFTKDEFISRVDKAKETIFSI
ncbi:MAG: hypothetical protein A2Y25_08910 [Candidatus Melainabacteria bacterium GWF2_37_15]|nr:MAG: hypothetical protein A2Y25_08910 [Candidatus Melainabacteria bacterium GWF2_37_15]